MPATDLMSFEDAVKCLLHGDFSRLDPLFEPDGQIIQWFREGRFASEPKALAEALSCACFNGRLDLVRRFMDAGLDPLSGDMTGMNGFHWAANRGQLDVVNFLIERKVPMEGKNMYDGTVLRCAAWSAIFEPKPMHKQIIAALKSAGASMENAMMEGGDERIDALLKTDHPS